MNSEKKEIQRHIINAAVELYEDDRAHFNMKGIAKRANLKPAEIYSYFPDKYHILSAFYNDIVPLYEEMVSEIEDYDNYNAGEKISNFVYTSLDLLGEHKNFVEQTYQKYIIYCPTKTRFRPEVRHLIADFLKNDENIPSFNRFFVNTICHIFLMNVYFMIVGYWIHDDSESYGKTMALIDKLTVLLNELLYNAILDKSFDLISFLASDLGISDTFSSIDNYFQKILNHLKI